MYRIGIAYITGGTVEARGSTGSCEYFVPLHFSISSVESTSYVFSFRMAFFYLVTTGWLFYISLFRREFNQ